MRYLQARSPTAQARPTRVAYVEKIGEKREKEIGYLSKDA